MACSFTSFYPPDIAVKWLKRYNNEEMEIKKEEGLVEVWGPVQTQPRTFRATAVLMEVENRLKDVDKDGEIVCRVEHCSLMEPIERVWTNSHFVVPTMPASLSVDWNNDGVGVFSLCLSGGIPLPKLEWAAGGSTLMPLISREIEKVTDRAGRELHSVCALVMSAVAQGSDANVQNLHNGNPCSSQFPLTQKEVEDGAMEGKRRQEKRLERAAVRPDPLGETRSEAGQIELESLYINTVNVGKERRRAKRERLRVAVEITHPALHLPVYCTWTEPEEEVQS